MVAAGDGHGGLVGAGAGFADVGVVVEVAAEGGPGFSGGGEVGGIGQPAFADADGHGEGEHAGGGGFGEGVGLVDELVPHAVGALELEECGHHFL